MTEPAFIPVIGPSRVRGVTARYGTAYLISYAPRTFRLIGSRSTCAAIASS